MLFPHNGIFLMTPPTLRFSFPPNVSRVCDKAVARGIAFIRPCCEEVCDLHCVLSKLPYWVNNWICPGGVQMQVDCCSLVDGA